jgi:hypothetical protein
MSDPDFASGDLHTGFIEEFMKRRSTRPAAGAVPSEVLVAAAGVAYRDSAASLPPATPDGHASAWKMTYRTGSHPLPRK